MVQARRRGRAGRAAARAHRRAVLGHRRSAGGGGRGGGQRHPRPRSRPAVLAADPLDDPELADRRRSLCARARAIRARRRHRGRHRARARQAAVRSVARAVPPVPHRAGLDPRSAGGPAARPRAQGDRPGRGAARPQLRHPFARGARRHQRHRAASGDVPRRQLCRRHHQAARLRQHLSLHRPPARPPRAGAVARDPGRGGAVRRPVGAPHRHPDRVRTDVYGDRADRAVLGGVDRAQLRQLPGGADPPPDRRGAGGLDRQPLCPGPDPARRKAISLSSARPSTA